jgi:hypothetical protein
MLICMLNNVLDMGRNVLLYQYVGAFYLYGRCVYLGLNQRGLKHFLTCILLKNQYWSSEHTKRLRIFLLILLS